MLVLVDGNVYMYRIAIEKLYRWKESKRRKLLIIECEKQVGKTWLMKEFGSKAYADLLDRQDYLMITAFKQVCIDALKQVLLCRRHERSGTEFCSR